MSLRRRPLQTWWHRHVCVRMVPQSFCLPDLVFHGARQTRTLFSKRARCCANTPKPREARVPRSDLEHEIVVGASRSG